MTNTIEINEDEYLALLQKNKDLQAKIDKYELFVFSLMRQVDKMIKDEQIC